MRTILYLSYLDNNILIYMLKNYTNVTAPCLKRQGFLNDAHPDSSHNPLQHPVE